MLNSGSASPRFGSKTEYGYGMPECQKREVVDKNTFYGCFGARAHTFELLSPCKLLLASCFQKGKTHLRQSFFIFAIKDRGVDLNWHPLLLASLQTGFEIDRKSDIKPSQFFVRKTFWKPKAPVFSCSTLRTTLPGTFPERVSRLSMRRFLYLRSKMADLRRFGSKTEQAVSSQTSKSIQNPRWCNYGFLLRKCSGSLLPQRSLVVRSELLFLDLFLKAFRDFRLQDFFIFDRRRLDLHQSGPAHYRAKRDSKMSENRVFKISSVDRNASCTSVSGLLGQVAPQASCCKVLSEATKQKPERYSMTKFLYSWFQSGQPELHSFTSIAPSVKRTTSKISKTQF